MLLFGHCWLKLTCWQIRQSPCDRDLQLGTGTLWIDRWSTSLRKGCGLQVKTGQWTKDSICQPGRGEHSPSDEVWMVVETKSSTLPTCTESQNARYMTELCHFYECLKTLPCIAVVIWSMKGAMETTCIYIQQMFAMCNISIRRPNCTCEENTDKTSLWSCSDHKIVRSN